MSRPLAVVLAVVAALVAALVALGATAEEVGRFVDPSTKQEIVRYRVAGGTTVLVSTPTNASSDLATSAILGVLAAAALVTARRARRVAGPEAERLGRFSLLFALGAAYLAVDESLELNETYGYNLERLGPLRDLDLVAYAVPALVFAFLFRDVLARSRPALLVGGLGAGLFVVAESLDASAGTLNTLEERLEPLSVLLLLAGFVLLAVSGLRRVYGVPPGVRSAR